MMTQPEGAEPRGGWTRLLTRTGRYEYQFQGSVPAVRNGRYQDARDYQFLVMDEEGWLYRIPVRMDTQVESALAGMRRHASAATSERVSCTEPLRVAEAQLRAGLESFRPRQNAPYPELDNHFAVDAARARELAGES